MAIYTNGKKIKSVYCRGKKVKQIYVNGKKLIKSGEEPLIYICDAGDNIKVYSRDEAKKQLVVKGHGDLTGWKDVSTHITASAVTKIEFKNSGGTIVFPSNCFYFFYGYYYANVFLNDVDFSKVNSAYCMFYNCYNMIAPIDKLKLTSLTNAQYMFYNCTNFTQDLTQMDASNITNCNKMFGNTKMTRELIPQNFTCSTDNIL